MNTNIDWNEKYGGTEYLFGKEPNKFLASQVGKLKQGMRCLDVGGGEGRNSVWLAEQGLIVLSIDQSDVALKKAQELAKERGVTIGTLPVDLFQWMWPKEGFDLMVSMHVHFNPVQRPLLNKMMFDALAPGGMVIFEAFHPDQIEYNTGGPSDLSYLVSAAMLQEDFPGAEFEVLEEVTVHLPDRAHKPAGPAVVTQAVIRKPA